MGWDYGSEKEKLEGMPEGDAVGRQLDKAGPAIRAICERFNDDQLDWRTTAVIGCWIVARAASQGAGGPGNSVTRAIAVAAVGTLTVEIVESWILEAKTTRPTNGGGP